METTAGLLEFFWALLPTQWSFCYLNDIKKPYPSGSCCFCVVLVGRSLIPLALIYMVQLTNQIINYPKTYWLKSTILLVYRSVGQQFGQGSVGWLFSSVFHLLGSFAWLHLVGSWAVRFKKITCMSGMSVLLHMDPLSTHG